MYFIHAAKQALQYAEETGVKAQWVMDLRDQLAELEGCVLKVRDRPAVVIEIFSHVKEFMVNDAVKGVLPLDLKNFSEAHDHVDANEYLITCGTFDDSGEEDVPRELYNQVIDLLDKWILTGGYAKAARDSAELIAREKEPDAR